jgi:YHS domain-containing protein
MKFTLALVVAGSLIASSLVASSIAQDKDKGGDKKPAPAAEAPKQDKGEHRAATQEEIIAAQLPLYPLTTCPVSGEKLDANAVNVVHDGQLVRFCCNKCPATFEKDPAATLKKIDDAVVAAQLKGYPLDKCAVAGEALGKDAVNYVQGSKLVRFCCAKCLDAFKKNPDQYVKKVDDAYIAAQLASYPVTHCIVETDEKLGPDGTDMLYGTRLVRFCCKKCPREFRKDPAKYIAILDKAAAEKAGKK